MRSVVLAVLLVFSGWAAPNGQAEAAPLAEMWDTVWSLPNKTDPAELEQYLDHLATAGFSGVWISLAPFYWQGGLAAENYAGEALESFSSPNPAYLAYVDLVLDEAAERGLQIAIAPAWGTDYSGVRPGIAGHSEPALDDFFDPDDPQNGQKAYDYGFLLGQRWGGHPALYAWVMGGDYYFGDSEPSTLETWAMMSAGLAAAGANEPVTYGPGGFASSWHVFADEPWLDFVSLNHHCLSPAELQSALEGLAVYGKPVVAAEVRYEDDDPPFCDPVVLVTPQDILDDAQAVVAAGAVGYVYGHHDRWAWDPPALLTLGSPGEVLALDYLGLSDPEPEPPPASEVVLVEPNGRWHLRVEGQPDWTFWFGVPGDVPLLGDWDGNGIATPGMYRPSSGFVYLTNSIPADGSVAVADAGLTFYYGAPGDQVLVGDWDGDGKDSLGVYRNGRVFLRDTNDTGIAHMSFWFGQPGDVAHGGSASGVADGVFLYRPSTGMVFYTKDLPTGDVATVDGSFSVGPTDAMAIGDWDSDGIDTVGYHDAGVVRLKNTNTSIPPEIAYEWGEAGWSAVAGVVSAG
ncbi:MAG: DUF4038 domain-containing protein [Acidimicrobiia bacterium]|nr:DUF4038 domain-containing protein [Acidimicrobiia bacterium]